MTKSQIPNAKEIPNTKLKKPRMDTNEHEFTPWELWEVWKV